jgi:nicotinate-nucleotide pyrophosphorylase
MRQIAPPVSRVAAAGGDLISFGWITHPAPIVDLGLDID